MQINFVDNMQLLNEILVNLLFFRVLISPTSIFNMPENCQIMVELTNTFDDQFENGLYYRKYLHRDKYLDSFTIDNLNIKADETTIGSDIFGVCSML